MKYDKYTKFIPLLEQLGFRVMGYEPGFLLCDPEDDRKDTFNIPLWAVEKLHEYNKQTISFS